MGLLAGLKVVELSRDVPAAYCGRQFAAWGADVIVAEPPGGHPLRRARPLATGRSGEDHSLLWLNVAAGKRTLAEDFRSLIPRADVFLTDYADDQLAALGLSLDDLHRDQPGLVICAISPFGRTGPYVGLQASELVVQALSGYLSLNGLPGDPPLRAPGHLTGYAVGVNAFVAALGACIKRVRTGCGDLVEVSAMETLAAVVPYLRVQYMARDKHREGGTEAGVRILPCADGWISLLISNPTHKTLWSEVLGIPADAWSDELYEGGYHDIVRKMTAFLSDYTRRMTAHDLFETLEKRAEVCGRVITPKGLLAEPQLEARGFFRRLDHPDLGEVRLVGPPGKLGRVGQDQPVLDRPVSLADVDWPVLDAAPQEARRAERPLEGMRVLDLTQAWIGPFATLLFADLGAQVIKIESHKRPDVWRSASPNPVAITNIDAKAVNRSHYFNSVNRDKLDLGLDLATPEGKALFLRLAKDADVVAENYTAHVMKRLGLDYPVLAAANPRLVMLCSSGFGKTGPWSDYRTNGSAIEALAGWDSMHAYPGGPPVLMGFYPADPICGLQMAAVTLACLFRRETTGKGEAIDGAMLEASVGYIGELILQAQFEGDIAPIGNRDPDMIPHGVFPCRGEDRWIALSVPDDQAWRALLALDVPAGLRAERFATADGRRLHQDALDALVADWTAGQDGEALMAALQAKGVPAGVVRTLAQALDDPHLAARDWFKPMARPDIGEHRYNGFAWSFADCELKAVIPPPRLGEHSEQVLREIVGLQADEIEALKIKDVVGSVL